MTHHTWVVMDAYEYQDPWFRYECIVCGSRTEYRYKVSADINDNIGYEESFDNDCDEVITKKVLER